MSRKWIWILAFFMGLAMISLIFVQAWWIKNAVDVKDDQFDQLITRTLSDVSREFQKQQAARHIVDELNPFYIDTSSDFYDSDFHFKSEFYFYSESEGDQLESELRRRDLDRRALVNNVLSRMLSFKPEIEDIINPENFKALVRKALLNKGIDMDFEYAVTKPNNLLVFKSGNFNPDADADYYRVQLTPDDLFASTDYLTIYFPAKRNFIFKSLGYMAISSIMLTVIIVLSFAVTIYIIIRQKRLSEIRTDFVNNMTHELKTPISTIYLASQMLGDKTIPATSKNIDNLSSVIIEESRRLGYQVEKVLQTALFKEGKLKLKLRETDIHELIQGVINNFSIQIKQKNGIIIPSLHAENKILNIDAVHITNVLSNLIDNAIKYCTRDPEIYVETQDHKEYLLISVRDNGIGIGKNDQKRIFDKFFRVSTGNVHPVKGFGLGLSYVKKIVDEHKGYINIESELYEGTTFRIYLPLHLSNL
jgi:two-component system phosphate regulon sensor histidine kinase PhoR